MSETHAEHDSAQSDDTVQDLRTFAYIIEQCKGSASVVMLEGQIFTEAADEIERLRRELAMNRLVRLSEELGLYESQETDQSGSAETDESVADNE
jgi:hypothetical protein